MVFLFFTLFKWVEILQLCEKILFFDNPVALAKSLLCFPPLLFLWSHSRPTLVLQSAILFSTSISQQINLLFKLFRKTNFVISKCKSGEVFYFYGELTSDMSLVFVFPPLVVSVTTDRISG